MPVASTHEFPQRVMFLRVIAQRLYNSPSQRLEEGLLGLAKIHPRGGVGLWISQSKSQILCSTWTVPVSDQNNM